MNNFIGQWVIDDISICDEIINYHKNSNKKHKGSILDIDSGKIQENPNIKISTDVDFDKTSDIAKKYFNELQKVINKYIEQYKYCNEYGAWDIVEGVNIQHYKPNEGYFSFHTERISNKSPVNNRHLVFMTYLNDVDDGGETEFYYQEIKTKPKKGLTVIFPADWTHTHRGITSPIQEKYIITGWLSYIS
jgi:prolyl 4-hydroxylase